jgi:hypothetical protein
MDAFRSHGAGLDACAPGRSRDVWAGGASSLAAIKLRTRSCRVHKGKDQRGRSTVECSLQGAAARIDAPQHQPVLAAQRLWVQYRDANYGFYGVQDGSIRQLQAAECIRSMTGARAREREKAMEFD